MSNKLSQLVKDIKYKTDKTIEQIAESIGYSRVHLGREMKKEESPAIEELLNEKYRDVLQIETSYTDKRRNLKNTKDATKLLAVPGMGAGAVYIRQNAAIMHSFVLILHRYIFHKACGL